MPPSEKEKMVIGELYRSADPELQAAAAQAQQHLRRLNEMPNEEAELRRTVLEALLGSVGESTQIKSPFQLRLRLEHPHRQERIYQLRVRFPRLQFYPHRRRRSGRPGVHIYTALHPLDARTRRSGLESAKPVTIGHTVWLGGSCVICPGVSIGDNTVVGTGSIVVRDLPDSVLAVGNPCRVIRQLS